MKKFGILLVVMVLLAALATIASAETPAPGGPFNTAFRIQNLATEDAACMFEFYDENGVSQYASGALPPINSQDSAYVYVPNLGVDAGQYAAVVSCDREVAAVVNYSDADSGASYSGVGGGEVATTLYAPGIYDNFYSYYSNIVVQNASGGVIDITLEIYEPGVTAPVYTDVETNVPANGFVNFEQEALTQLATNQFYSAKIIGTGDIAAIVNIYGRGSFDGQLYSYNPFASGSTTAFAPVIMNNFYGNNTSLVIQNIGTVETDVTITYSTGLVKTATIGAGEANSRYTPAEGLPTGTLTGVKVESDGQPIVLLVNESNDKNRAASYSGFAAGANNVSAPIVMRRYYEYNTSITCQNIGAFATDITIQYGGIAGSNTVAGVAAGDNTMFYQPADSLVPDNWIGSATITAAEPIVCVVNEDMNENPAIMDQLYAYNGIGY